MYQKIFQSSKLVNPEQTIDSWKHMFYQPAWDAFLLVGGSEYARLFRDGTKFRFGTRSGGFEPLGKTRGGLAWWSSWTYRIYPAFEITGLPDENQIFNPNWQVEYGKGPSTTRQAFVDEIARVYLCQPNANRFDVYSLDTGELLYQIAHNTGNYFTVIAWADIGQVACMVKSNGKVRFINYLHEKAVLESGRVDPFLVGAYDCQNHNFVTIGSDKKVRVYYREAFPANLSAPEFEPVQVRGLKAHKVKTRLTGSDGEPCSGWWVNWEVLAYGQTPPMGYLDKSVSQTNKEGWAYNLYFGPDDGSTGQNQLRVRVAV